MDKCIETSDHVKTDKNYSVSLNQCFFHFDLTKQHLSRLNCAYLRRLLVSHRNLRVVSTTINSL